MLADWSYCSFSMYGREYVDAIVYTIGYPQSHTGPKACLAVALIEFSRCELTFVQVVVMVGPGHIFGRKIVAHTNHRHRNDEKTITHRDMISKIYRQHQVPEGYLPVIVIRIGIGCSYGIILIIGGQVGKA